MSRRKVLIVTPFPIEPEVEGNRRRIKVLANQLIELGADVYIALLPLKIPKREELAFMKARWGKKLYVMPPKYPTSAAARANNKAQRLALAAWDKTRRLKSRRQHTGVDEYYFRWWNVRLLLLQRVKRFDIVFAEYIFMSRAFDAFRSDVLKVIDTHDVFADRNKKMSQSGLSYKWWSVTETEEAIAIRRADVTLAIEAGEAEHFQRYTNQPVYCVPHVPELEIAADSPNQNRLLIVASGNPINVQGVRWFLTDVFPRVLARHGGVSLHIVGDVCNSLGDLANDGSKVQLLGRVESLKPHYAAADVVINPVLIGTGLCIKSIEALAHGRPLISTVSGARGIAAEAGLFVTNSVEGMVDCIDQVLSSSADRLLAIASGRHYLQSARDANQRLLARLLAQADPQKMRTFETTG